jgi:hypothetical protein
MLRAASRKGGREQRGCAAPLDDKEGSQEQPRRTPAIDHRERTALTTETRRREGFNHRDTESTEIRRLRSKTSVFSMFSVVQDPGRSALSVVRTANHAGGTALTTETRRREGFNHRDR